MQEHLNFQPGQRYCEYGLTFDGAGVFGLDAITMTVSLASGGACEFNELARLGTLA